MVREHAPRFVFAIALAVAGLWWLLLVAVLTVVSTAE